MKPTCAFFVLFSLFSFFNLNYARKEPGEDYWRSTMKDQPLPEAIRERFIQDPASVSESNRKSYFVKNFDTWQSAIIYHGRDETGKAKRPCQKELQSRHDDELKEQRSFIQQTNPSELENPTRVFDQKQKKDALLYN